MNATSSPWTRATAGVRAVLLPLWLLLRPLPPLPLRLLLLEADKARTVHQLAAVQGLGLSWLAAHYLPLLQQRLEQRLQQLQSRPASPTSTSSRKKTARRTGKRRR